MGNNFSGSNSKTGRSASRSSLLRRQTRLAQGSTEPAFDKQSKSSLRVLVRSTGIGGGFSFSEDPAGRSAVLAKLHDMSQGSQFNKRRPLDYLDAETLKLADGTTLVGASRVLYWGRMDMSRQIAWTTQMEKDAQAIVYVVDLDPVKFLNRRGWETDLGMIQRILKNKHLSGKPLLILCDYEDGSSEEIPPNRVFNLLGLASEAARLVKVIECSSTTGAGLEEALSWITSSLRPAHKRTKIVSGLPEESLAPTDSETDESSDDSSRGASYEHQERKLDYDPTLRGGNATLQRFEPIKNGTQCPFARAATLWGGKPPPYKSRREWFMSQNTRIEDEAAANVQGLTEFVRAIENGEKLDGFTLELGRRASGDEDFGEMVGRVLTELAKNDPSGENCLSSKTSVGSSSWRFRFAGADFFITSFSPLYPEKSSRYAFGTRGCFLLFQPMSSFARHKLPPDTPASSTQWDDPKTIRDKTRVAFKEAGRGYHIPETLPYPVAEHIVKPTEDNGENVIRWWEPKPKESSKKMKKQRKE